VIEPPSGRVTEKGPRWVLTRTEACGGGKVFLVCPLVYEEYLGIYRTQREVGGLPGDPQARGCALRACGALGTLLTWTPSPVDVFWSRKNQHKFYSVWNPFGIHFL